MLTGLFIFAFQFDLFLNKAKNFQLRIFIVRFKTFQLDLQMLNFWKISTFPFCVKTPNSQRFLVVEKKVIL